MIFYALFVGSLYRLIAQLVRALPDKAKVTGSNPVGPTSSFPIVQKRNSRHFLRSVCRCLVATSFGSVCGGLAQLGERLICIQ